MEEKQATVLRLDYCQYLLSSQINYTLFVGHQWVAGGNMADKTDDFRGNLLVGHFAPGGFQVDFAESPILLWPTLFWIDW
jgi:hypothetical protein